MAEIEKTPEGIHPAYNLINFLFTSATPEQVDIILQALYPNDTETVTITRDFIVGTNRVDVHGKVKRLFRDITDAIATNNLDRWAWDDYNLKVNYQIDGERYTAINCAKQLGQRLEMFGEDTNPFKSTALWDDDSHIMRLKAYPGYPIGTAVMYAEGYDFELTGAWQFTVQVDEDNLTLRWDYQSAANGTRTERLTTTGVTYIDWGDGTLSTELEPHTYETPGTYAVQVLAPGITLLPIISGISTNDGTLYANDCVLNRITSIASWGDDDMWISCNINCMTLLASVAAGLPYGRNQSLNYLCSAAGTYASSLALPDNLFSKWAGKVSGTILGTLSNLPNTTTFTYRILQPFSACTNLNYLFGECVVGSNRSKFERYLTYLTSNTDLNYHFSGCVFNYGLPANTFTGHNFEGRLTSVQMQYTFQVGKYPTGAVHDTNLFTPLSGTFGIAITRAFANSGDSVSGLYMFEEQGDIWLPIKAQVTTHSYTYANSYLYSTVGVPTGFLSNYTRCTTFEGMFNGAFSGAANTGENSRLRGMPVISNCPALTSINSLISNNRLYSPFNLDWLKNSSLPNVTNIGLLFLSTYSRPDDPEIVLDLPEGLFSGMPEITEIRECFSQTRLKFSGDPFSANTEIVSAISAFSSPQIECVMWPTLFANCKKITSFVSCFARVGNRYYTGESPVDENGLHLYERAGQAGYPTSISASTCFNQQTQLDDYASIPTSWR